MSARAPPPEEDSPGDAPREGDEQVERVRQVLAWLTPGAFLLAAFEGIGFAAWRDPASAVAGAVLFAYGAFLLAARESVRRGEAGVAVVTTCASVLASALVIATLQPSLAPTLALVPLLVFALALPFIGPPGLRVLAAGVVLVVLGVAAAGEWMPTRPLVPAWWASLLSVVSLGGAAGMVLLLLWQSHSWVRESLEETRRAKAALEVANERLQELDRMKTQFLNNAAHELRTPLTPIKVQMHLLRSPTLGDLTDRQQKAIAVLDRNLERLNVLVQDVLDIARLQAGHFKMRQETVGLDRLVADVAESFAEPARAAGVALETRATPGLSVSADAQRLTQVLFNLLTNALKFTPPGGRVTIVLDRDRDLAILHVRDSGIGMKAEDLPRLFQPFSQVHDTMQSTRAGTGLGLFICRGIVEQHGGSIWCESAGPGRGSTFSIALPLLATTPISDAEPTPTR